MAKARTKAARGNASKPSIGEQEYAAQQLARSMERAERLQHDVQVLRDNNSALSAQIDGWVKRTDRLEAELQRTRQLAKDREEILRSLIGSLQLTVDGSMAACNSANADYTKAADKAKPQNNNLCSERRDR